MSGFYRAFEERYYAPREAIKNLRRQYLPFVEPIKGIYETQQTFDLGCGRGEWLELMEELGFKALGVDLDDGMLSDCYERNLSALKGDAVSFLQKLDTESQIVVSAFHVVEHISFSELQIVVQEALRVLKPAGLLIMETPNPENLIVASKNFYLDPTHQRPIPSELLSFLAEHCGFARVKTIRLQEREGISANNKLALFDVLSGASPDYAVVAQKKGPLEVCAKFDSPFKRSYGIDLQSLANNYDQQAEEHTQWLKNEWSAAKQRVEELSKSAGYLEAALAVESQRVGNLAAELKAVTEHDARQQAHAQWLQSGWDTARQQIEELSKNKAQLESEFSAANEHNAQLQAHTQWLQNEFNAANEHNARLQAHAQWLQGILDEANAKVHELSQENQSIYASTFWRVTWPLRKTMQIAKWSLALPARIIEWAIRLPKRMAKLLLVWAMRKSLNNPSIKNRALSKLAKYPRLKQHLRLLAARSGLIAGGNMTSRAGHSFSFESQSAVATTYSSNMQEESIDTLSPRAARIYAELKKSIDTRNN